MFQGAYSKILSAGLVNDWMRTQPFTPNTPATRPSVTWRCSGSGSGRLRLRGDLDQILDTLGHLGAVAAPMRETLEIDQQLLFLTRGVRVVVPKALKETTVTPATACLLYTSPSPRD